jgi:type III secretion protein U
MSDSGEKELPASQRKLRKARDRGEVASSPDFVSAFTFTAVSLTMLSQLPQIVASVRSLLDRSVLVAEGTAPFAPVAMLQSFALDMIGFLAVPAVVILASATLSNVLIKQGLPLSLEPLMPKFSRISPAGGLKNIFSGHGLIMMAMAIGKFTIWSFCVWYILKNALGDVIASGACGQSCLLTVGYKILKSMFIFALAIIVIAGLADVPLQIMRFLGQQKMTKQEQKKEFEDSEGKAEVKGHRRQLQQEMAQTAPLPKEGLAVGSVIVTDGERAIALMFRQDKDEIPTVLARGEGLNAAEIIAAGRGFGLYVEEDAELTARMYKKLRPGDPISQDLYEPIAMLLVKGPRR